MHMANGSVYRPLLKALINIKLISICQFKKIKMVTERKKSLGIPTSSTPLCHTLEPTLEFFEVYVRKPMEGTWLDTYIFKPAKEYYMKLRRRE